MLYMGEPMKNMADALRLKPKAVEYHLYRLYHLTRSRCAVQAVRWGVEHGYLPELRRKMDHG